MEHFELPSPKGSIDSDDSDEFIESVIPDDAIELSSVPEWIRELFEEGNHSTDDASGPAKDVSEDESQFAKMSQLRESEIERRKAFEKWFDPLVTAYDKLEDKIANGVDAVLEKENEEGIFGGRSPRDVGLINPEKETELAQSKGEVAGNMLELKVMKRYMDSIHGEEKAKRNGTIMKLVEMKRGAPKDMPEEKGELGKKYNELHAEIRQLRLSHREDFTKFVQQRTQMEAEVQDLGEKIGADPERSLELENIKQAMERALNRERLREDEVKAELAMLERERQVVGAKAWDDVSGL